MRPETFGSSLQNFVVPTQSVFSGTVTTAAQKEEGTAGAKRELFTVDPKIVVLKRQGVLQGQHIAALLMLTEKVEPRQFRERIVTAEEDGFS